jgi:hypothetical protein
MTIVGFVRIKRNCQKSRNLVALSVFLYNYRIINNKTNLKEKKQEYGVGSIYLYVCMYVLPELRILLDKESICRTLSRGKEVWSRNSEALKVWGGNEMRSVCFNGRKRTNFKFSFRREVE